MVWVYLQGHAARAAQDGKASINGGLASIPAVQSGFNMAHSSGLAGAALANHQAFTQQQVTHPLNPPDP